MTTSDLLLLLLVAAGPWVLLVIIRVAKRPEIPDESQRIERIERKLDLILRQLGIEFRYSTEEEIRDLVRAHKKINAIKLYRQTNGVGLKEAKDVIDAIQREEESRGES